MTGPGRPGRWPLAAFDTRSLPAVIGLLSALLTWYVWGSLDAVAAIHDEASYLLQARLFASLRAAAASPPIPEFFEQFHVLVHPVFASKYPPGHALALVPGVWLGAPGLMPVAMTGLTAALLVSLVRRFTNPWIALLTWALWMLSWGTLRFRPTYMSEVTTGLLWLVAWWALLRWRDTGRRGWLLAMAAAVGWGAITRPVTMLAFAIPVAVVVLVVVARERRWRDLVLALAVGTAFVALLPLWNARTTGDWKSMSWSLYGKQYTPWDRVGFGWDSTPPQRALPADRARFADDYREVQTAHAPAILPRVLRERVLVVWRSVLPGWRAWLSPFAVVGLVALAFGALGVSGQVALATSALLFLAYLPYAHVASWSIYYLEAEWLIPLAAAVGVWWLASLLGSIRDARRRGLAFSARPSLRAPSLEGAVACGALVVALALGGIGWLKSARDGHARVHAYHAQWRDALRGLPTPRSVVFVRYAPGHNPHVSLITNDARLDQSPVWVVYDRGPAENARLMALAPGRQAYLFDEAAGRLESVGR